MEVSSLRKNSSNRLGEQNISKKNKRILHIKSLPVDSYQSPQRISHSKGDSRIKDQPQIKMKRFKTQQHIKSPVFGVVKTTREQYGVWNKKGKQHTIKQSKSFSKSTNIKSIQLQKDSPRTIPKLPRNLHPTSMKNIYSGTLVRLKEVMESYQLKMNRCLQQKQMVIKENDRLRNQISHLHKWGKKSLK